VDGTGSTWNITSDFDWWTWTGLSPLGLWRGNATLNITNGGAVRLANSNTNVIAASIGGRNATANVTVDGAGSILTGMDMLEVGSTAYLLGFGFGGVGTLTISNGGVVRRHRRHGWRPGRPDNCRRRRGLPAISTSTAVR